MASRSHPDVSTVNEDPPQMGIKRASTFPKHIDTKPAAAAASPFESSWSQSGGSSYGAQTPTSAPFDATTFAAASQRNVSQAGGGMAGYSSSQGLGNPALTDLSSMMFPSAEEPFGYPNQPLTTFENNQQFSKNSIYPSQMYNNMGSNSPMPSLRGRDENIEAQFYPLPPYIEQRQQALPLQSQRFMGATPSMGFGATQAQSGNAAQAMQIPNGGWAGQQSFPQDLGDININGLFGGGEWLPPGYPSYQG